MAVCLWTGSAIAFQPSAQAGPPGAGYTPKAVGMETQLEENTINKDVDTPEEIRRRSNQFTNRAERASDNLIERAQEGLENTADNVREKLNLDQPIAPETKRFIRDARENIESAVDSTSRAIESR
ncbi:MAG: hypothetical protein HC881_10300 [Leptolyngbyaceae cyanobacterium SL_7_1]|nr:hypothetical protein [Leptolyngbyaceae cyanobacterium SL_7_1]